MKKACALLVAFTALGCAQQSIAAVLPAFLSTEVSYWGGVPETKLLFGFSNATPTTGPAIYSNCFTPTPTATACGTSYAAFGVLRNQSTMQELDPSTITGIREHANAASWFRDVLTISGLSSGTYYLVPTVSIDGTSSWNNVSLPNTVVVGINEFGPDGATILSTTFADATTSSFAQTFTLAGVPFTPGTPFDFMIQFGTGAIIYQGPTASENTFVDANFFSTMLVTGFQVFDSNGTNVGSYSITAVSGLPYGPNGITVPEPTTLALLGLGLAGLAASRRRRQ